LTAETTERYVQLAGKAFRGIEERVKSGGEGKGNVTTSTVRKILELANRSKSYLEFKLRFGHMVARNIEKNKGHPLEKFYRNLITIMEKDLNKNLTEIKDLMNYVVMKHYVLSKLESVNKKNKRMG